MARKRSEIKNKKSLKKTIKKNKFGLFIFLILVLFLLASVWLIGSYNSDQDLSSNFDNDDDLNSENTGKWLFAMDDDNVQYKYQANGIPTLVIIDKKGNVVFYNSGYHHKEDIQPYIDKALDGTAESIGDSIDFTVTTFNNEEFTLSEKKGEVIILDIMGVGCPPCELQMPELQEIKKEKGDNIIILSVDVRYSGENKQGVIDTYGEYIVLPS